MGRVDSSRCSLLARGEVDSIALMRTMVRPRRFSSEPTFAARSARTVRVPIPVSAPRARLRAPALPANSSRPGILAQRVNHGSPNATFSKRLELDAARLVKPVRCVDEPNHTILDKISMSIEWGIVAATRRALFYKGNAGNNARILRTNLGAHECDLRRHVRQPRTNATNRRASQCNDVRKLL